MRGAAARPAHDPWGSVLRTGPFGAAAWQPASDAGLAVGGASVVREDAGVPAGGFRDAVRQPALRLVVAGCRHLIEALDPVLRGYGGLAAVETVGCRVDRADLEGHVGEAHGGVPPETAERLHGADAVVLPPGTPVRSLVSEGVAAVAVELAPACILDGLRDQASPPAQVALLLPGEAVSRVLVAALSQHAADLTLLTYVGVEQLDAQLALVGRLRAVRVLADPVAAALAQRRGLPARSIYDGPGRCLLVHAIERALAQASLRRLRRIAHGGAPAGGLEATPLYPAAAPRRPRALPVRDVVALRTARRFVLVPAASISYVSSRGGLVTAYTDGGAFWSDLTLGELEARLDPRRFVRLDASRLVNLSRATELVPWTHQRYTLRLGDPAKTELVLSRDVGRRLRALLGW